MYELRRRIKVNMAAISNQLTLWTVFSLGIVLYANYQFIKWIFKSIRTAISSSFSKNLIKRLTPKSVVQKRIQTQNKKIIDTKNQEIKDHEEARERARKYQDQYFNIPFIEEDRAELFAGYEDIKWQYGRQSINRKFFNPPESKKIAFWMFQEMAAYRYTFQERGKWTPQMELFWLKILPPQFRPQRNFLEEQIKKAEDDFNSDESSKFSA